MIQFIKDNKIIFHPNIDLEATGKNIKYLREEKGLSVKKLADILEFETVQGIYRWQEGKTNRLIIDNYCSKYGKRKLYLMASVYPLKNSRAVCGITFRHSMFRWAVTVPHTCIITTVKLIQTIFLPPTTTLLLILQ